MTVIKHVHPPPKQLNTLWRWWRREWRREQTADNSNSTHCHEALQEVAQLENRDCVATLLPSFSSWNQPGAVSCRRTAQKEEKEVQKPINKKYEAGDYMHSQWSTQGPQPLGGIVSVIASLALQIVVTNFLLSLKMWHVLSLLHKMGYVLILLEEIGYVLILLDKMGLKPK